MELKYCSAHPHQLITNFCSRVECLQELCPVCICSHTEKHERVKTLSKYEPISETFSNCQKLIQQQVSAINHSKNEVMQHRLQWENKKKSAFDQINQAEQQTLSAVIQTFDQIKYSLSCEIERYEQRTGEHSQQQIASIINVYDEQINRLRECSRQLASNQIAYIRILLNQVLPTNQQFIESVGKDLQKRQTNNIVVNSDLEAVKSSIVSCVRSNVGFGFESSSIVITNIPPAIVLPVRTDSVMRSSSIVQNNGSLLITSHMSDSGLFSARCSSLSHKNPKSKQSTFYVSSTQPQFSQYRGQENGQKHHISATAVAPFAVKPSSLTKFRRSIFTQSWNSLRA